MVLDSTLNPSAPTIDATEARWVADELAALIRRVGPDSVTGLVLRQAQQELQSLTRGGQPGARGEVVGPIRLRIAG